MKEFFRKRLPTMIIGLSSLVAIWLIWFLGAKTIKNEYVLPTFSQTISALFEVVKEEFFWRALSNTLLKTLYAFIISFLLAGIFSAIEKLAIGFGVFMKPIIIVIRTLPTMAVLVLILIYTDRFTAPIIVAVMVMFPMIYAQFNVAFKNIDDGIISATKVFRLTKKQKLFKVYLPLIAPPVISHIGSNLSFGIKLIVSAEIMAYTYVSLGGMMQTASGYMEVARLAGLTLVAVILGLILELVFYLTTRFAFKWNVAEVNND